jgi:hypothetical protein
MITQRCPAGTVTVTPEATVIGPTLNPFTPAASVVLVPNVFGNENIALVLVFPVPIELTPVMLVNSTATVLAGAELTVTTLPARL